jgi:hypothetical protein
VTSSKYKRCVWLYLLVFVYVLFFFILTSCVRGQKKTLRQYKISPHQAHVYGHAYARACVRTYRTQQEHVAVLHEDLEAVSALVKEHIPSQFRYNL